MCNEISRFRLAKIACDARYRQMLQLFEEEPEWHDGEVVYEGKPLA